MRIRQLFSFSLFILLTSGATFTMAQDYTPSADVQAAIVAAQADGNVTDAEAASLAQAMAADGANAAAVATTLSTNVGASSVQVAAGLAAVGQTQNQIANTLVATGVSTQAEAQATAQQGQTAAVASGAAQVATTAQATTAAAQGTLAVSGAGLITDSSGKAVVVKNAGDQLLLVKAIIQGNKDNGGTSSPESNANLTNALNSALADIGAPPVTSTGDSGSLDDLLASAEEAINVAEETTGTDLDDSGSVGASPSTT